MLGWASQQNYSTDWLHKSANKTKTNKTTTTHGFKRIQTEKSDSNSTKPKKQLTGRQEDKRKADLAPAKGLAELFC